MAERSSSGIGTIMLAAIEEAQQRGEGSLAASTYSSDCFMNQTRSRPSCVDLTAHALRLMSRPSGASRNSLRRCLPPTYARGVHA